MAIAVRVNDVRFPNALHLFGFKTMFADGTLHEPSLVVVYTGWVEVDFRAGDELQRERVLTFLPTGFGGHVNTIEIAGGADADLDDFSVMAAPASFTDRDTPNILAVDGAELNVQIQSQLPDEPICLVLSLRCAVRNAAINRVSYQVTVRFRPNFLPGEINATGHAPGE